jgi:hypothetical protein
MSVVAHTRSVDDVLPGLLRHTLKQVPELNGTLEILEQ